VLEEVAVHLVMVVEEVVLVVIENHLVQHLGVIQDLL
jgi:hypothetical protein